MPRRISLLLASPGLRADDGLLTDIKSKPQKPSTPEKPPSTHLGLIQGLSLSLALGNLLILGRTSAASAVPDPGCGCCPWRGPRMCVADLGLHLGQLLQGKCLISGLLEGLP